MLLDQISEVIEKEGLGEEVGYTPVYSSGIDVLDYRNGYYNEDGEVNVGVDGGRIITVIGKSGTGKSSLGIKIACSIVEGYEEGAVIHYDFERASSLARVLTISGWSKKMVKQKYKILRRDIYSESVFQIVKHISNIKNEPSNFERLRIDTGKVTDNGEPIYVLPPTVILLDSWALMTPRDISEEEKLSGSMSASSIAKTNNAVIKRIVGALEKGNITLIIINHINKKIDINQFAKTQADINYLKQD